MSDHEKPAKQNEEANEELAYILHLLQKDRVQQYFEARRKVYYENLKPFDFEEYYENSD